MTNAEASEHGVSGGRQEATLAPFRLTPFFSERVWGKRNLAPWYSTTGTSEPVGEAWLTGPQCLIETGPLAGKRLDAAVAEQADILLGRKHGQAEFPLLVKMLFPADKLSVQVHPDDEQAQRIGEPRGKTECWYVLEAEPGATVALGLKPGVTLDQVRSSIANGTLEDRLNMLPVSAGDMIFVDAGTVHAIGPGVVLLETQQTSDRTYRMFDYGRPRELHVEQGLGVTRLETRAGKVQPQAMNGFTRLIDEQYFRVDRFDLEVGSVAVTMEGPSCLVGLAGELTVRAPDSSAELLRGTAIIAAAGSEVTLEASAPASFMRCSAPVPR